MPRRSDIRITNPRARPDPVAYMDRVRESDFGRRYKSELRRLLEITEGLAVLEVGCGTGDDLASIRSGLGEAGRAVGIDHDERMIQAARSRTAGTAGLEFQVRDLFAAPFPRGSFDRCFADRVFHLVGARTREALDAMAQMTRPGGLVVVANPDVDSFVLDIGEPGLSRRILCWLADQGFQGGQLVNLFRDRGLCEVEAVASSWVETCFAAVDESTPLRELAERACAAGAIEAGELERWLGALESAVAGDRFAFCSTQLIVRGRKPDEGPAVV